MPYTITRHPNFTVELHGQLDADAVAHERDEVVRALRRQARVPGFRPGKAPLGLIRSRFAGEIEEELKDRLAGLVWQEVVEGEEGLEPLTRPRVRSVDLSDEGFELDAEVEVRPRFDLPEVSDLTLPEVSVEVTDAEVDVELGKIAKEHASWDPVDDGTEATDGLLVEADLAGEVVEGEGEPYTEEGARFVIGAEGVPPEISEVLQGAKPGDEREASKRFEADDEHPARTVSYRIVVKGLYRQEVPDIDDDLAKTIGLDTLDELRERVREAVVAQKHKQRRDTWLRGVLDQLQEGIDPAELPSSLVHSAVEEDMQRLVYSMAMQGVSPEENDINWQEIATRVEPQSRKKVLDRLVLDQLADAWDLPVPEDDVDRYIRTEADRRGVPPAEHRATLAKEGNLERIRHAARVTATETELIRRAGGEVEP